MSRLVLAVALLLACFPLAAEIVSPEVPVSDLRLAADSTAWCGVASGATKAYAICSYNGSASHRFDLDAEGKPLLYTRTPFAQAGAAWTVAGDSLFYTERKNDSIAVRRFGSDALARFDAASPLAPQLTWNRALLLLLTYNVGDVVMGAILDQSLNVLVPPFPILTAGAPKSVASAGGGFLVVARDTARVAGAIVDARGSVHPVTLPTPSVANAVVASNGSEYLYVWQRDRTPIATQHYSASGEAVGDVDAIAGSNSNVFLSTAVWSGSDYLVLWMDGQAAWMRAPGGAPQPLGNGYPSLWAGPAGTYLAMWNGNAPQTIRRLDTNGVEQVVAYWPPQPQAPMALAMSDVQETAVVWSEGKETRIGRIGMDGSHLDGAGVVVNTDNVPAAVAFDGVYYLVVWIKSPHVWGRFFSRNGRLGEAAFPIGDETNNNQVPSITWTGTQYVVAWVAGKTGVGTGAIVTTSAATTTFQYGVGYMFGPTISAGPRTLVAYQTSENIYAKITGVFLDAAGEPFDMIKEALYPIPGNLSQPRTATNGRDFLLTWRKQTQAKTEAWVARIDDRGHLLGTPFVAASCEKSVAITPLFDGRDYRVVVSGVAEMPLFAAAVTEASFACGCLEERLPIPVDFDLTTESRSVVATATRDGIAVAYDRGYPQAVSRTVVRFVRTPPAPKRRAGGR